jgi:hypothetical protein
LIFCPIFLPLASITFGLYFIPFSFYFNGVMLSLKLKSFPFSIFILTELSSSSHSFHLF